MMDGLGGGFVVASGEVECCARDKAYGTEDTGT